MTGPCAWPAILLLLVGIATGCGGSHRHEAVQARSASVGLGPSGLAVGPERWRKFSRTGRRMRIVRLAGAATGAAPTELPLREGPPAAPRPAHPLAGRLRRRTARAAQPGAAPIGTAKAIQISGTNRSGNSGRSSARSTCPVESSRMVASRRRTELSSRWIAEAVLGRRRTPTRKDALAFSRTAVTLMWRATPVSRRDCERRVRARVPLEGGACSTAT